MRRSYAPLILLLLLTFACSKGNEPAGTRSPAGKRSSAEGTTAPKTGDLLDLPGLPGGHYSGQADVRGKSSHTIVMDRAGLENAFFAPTVLIGSPGQRLALAVQNRVPAVLHNFSIDSERIDTDVDSGKSVVVRVTFPSSGLLPFYCKYHYSNGQSGALVATEGNVTYSCKLRYPNGQCAHLVVGA